MKKRFLLSVAIGAIAVPMLAGNVKGRVINAVTGLPVDGATIRVDDSLAGCITNNNGEFSISDIPEGNHTLRISHLGFAPLKYKISSSDFSNDIVIELEESYVNLAQVVVTGTGTHHRMADTPVPVTVITSADIKNSSATTLEEALTKLNPSFSFSTNGMGTTMTLNGIAQDYVLILLNGKKMAGEDTYSRINIESVKRIEVLNGAASALYGTDAIGGVINIITDEPKNTIQATSNTRVSSHGRWSEAVSADVSVGKFSSFTNYRRSESDSWQLNPIDEDGLITGKMNSVGFFSNNFDQKFAYNATDKLSFYIRGNYYNHSTDRPENSMSQDEKDSDKFSPAYTYDVKHESFLYGAGAKYIINKNAYIEADFYSDNYKSEYEYFGNDSHERGEISLQKRTAYYNANVKGIFSLGDNNKLSAGVEYINEHLKSEKTKSADPIDKSMYTTALFAQDEWKISKYFYSVFGLRYIYHQNFNSYATPNISLMYKNKGFNLRASYAGGFRTPDLTQMYTTNESTTTSKLTIPNTNLKPEKSNYYALNAEYTNSWLSVTATGFFNKIHDMINYRILSDEEAASLGYSEYSQVQQRDNIDKARVFGVNVFTNAYLGAGISLGVGYSYNDAMDETNDKPIDKSLKHSGSVNAKWGHTWGKYRLSVNVNGRIQGERYSQRYDPAPKFSLWDLNTRHTFNLKNIVLEPGIGIENIFNYKDDRPWNNNFATLTPGRSVYGSLVITFKK